MARGLLALLLCTLPVFGQEDPGLERNTPDGAKYVVYDTTQWSQIADVEPSYTWVFMTKKPDGTVEFSPSGEVLATCKHFDTTACMVELIAQLLERVKKLEDAMEAKKY